MKQTQTNKIEWKEVELKNLGELIMGQSPKGNTYNLEKKGVPLLNGAADIKNNKINPKQFTTKPTKLSKKGDILFCIRATIGKSIISDGEYCLGRGVAGFRANPNLLKINLLLKLLDEKLKELIPQGSTIVGVKAKDIERLRIFLPFSNNTPNLKEQKRIVKILEDSWELNEKGKKIEKLFNEYLKSVFWKMFYDKEFEEINLGNKQYFEIQSGGTPSRTKKEYWENGKIPWIGSTACKDLPVNKAEQFITEKGQKNSSAKLFPKGTLLIALVGATIGKTGILTFECSTNQNIAGIIIKDKEKINSTYLFFSLKGLYNQFISLSNASFKMANLSFIRSLKIPLPPIPLQEKFAKIVEQIEKMRERINKTKQNSEELFNSLVSKGFRGEL